MKLYFQKQTFAIVLKLSGNKDKVTYFEMIKIGPEYLTKTR